MSLAVFLSDGLLRWEERSLKSEKSNLRKIIFPFEPTVSYYTLSFYKYKID